MFLLNTVFRGLSVVEIGVLVSVMKPQWDISIFHKEGNKEKAGVLREREDYLEKKVGDS